MKKEKLNYLLNKISNHSTISLKDKFFKLQKHTVIGNININIPNIDKLKIDNFSIYVDNKIEILSKKFKELLYTILKELIKKETYEKNENAL